jgi:oxygen-dependent protoporphyrinogen oxidase
MEVLPRAIQRRYADRLRLGSPVEAIERSGGEWNVRAGGESYSASRVVLAAGARPAARLLDAIAPGAAAALRRIEYPAVATVLSLYRRADVTHPLDGFGVLIPEVERRNVLGVIFSSTLFPNRAPDGTVALTTFVGGARQPELALQTPEAIASMVHAEHRSLLGVAADPIEVEVNTWPEAIPQANLGHGDILADVEAAERELSGLQVLGNFRGGVSVGDCVKSAWERSGRSDA